MYSTSLNRSLESLSPVLDQTESDKNNKEQEFDAKDRTTNLPAGIPGAGAGGSIQYFLQKTADKKTMSPATDTSQSTALLRTMYLEPTNKPEQLSRLERFHYGSIADAFLEQKNHINKVAIRVQWAFFVNCPNNTHELKSVLQKNLQSVLNRIIDPNVKKSAEVFVREKLKEKPLYVIKDNGGVFFNKGTDLDGMIFRINNLSQENEAEFHYVPDTIDSQRQAQIFQQDGPNMQGFNILGTGSSAKVKFAFRIREKDLAVSVAKLYTQPAICKQENEFYDCIDPENPYILKKQGFYAPPGTAGITLFEQAVGGDCEKFMVMLLIKSSLSASAKEKLVSALLQRCTAAVNSLHNNKKTNGNESIALPISHSDIKLNNFLLVRRKGKYHVVISDFGLATMDLKGIRPGAKDYRPPEYEDKNASPRLGDIWSLGVTYKKITVDLPNGEYKNELMAVADKMLHLQPENRVLPNADEPCFKKHDISDDDFAALIDFVRAEAA